MLILHALKGNNSCKTYNVRIRFENEKRSIVDKSYLGSYAPIGIAANVIGPYFFPICLKHSQ